MLGFHYLRHAGKITGLAAYGNPKVLYDKVAKLLWADGLVVKTSPLIYILRQEYLLKNKLPKYFGNHSREDIAAAFQKRLEDVTSEVIRKALKLTAKNKIVLSGGVAGNVIMNQRIHDIEGVKEIFVHPAMSDSGQALGAALFAYNTELKRQGKYFLSERLKDVYLGSDYTGAEVEKAVKDSGLEYRYIENIETEVASLLAAKKVVARFNGRMEYGPRALGNRSILFHAGDHSVNDWLNQRLERSEFMPFAPSVLMEDIDEYFVRVKGAEYTAEFMTITFDCTEKMKRLCPAVVHVDGTARPHFVTATANPSYYKIIKEYKKITGISVILNTSFNMHEEPIVCSPMDAIHSFLRGHLDYLAIGNYLVKYE
jgi:carbamoyltransferase